MLAEKLHQHDDDRWTGPWNFGPFEDDIITVAKLAESIVRQWGCGGWKPLSINRAPHEARYLTLDSSKARQLLGWHPRLCLEEAIAMTVEWYRVAISEARDNMYDVSCQTDRLLPKQNYQDNMTLLTDGCQLSRRLAEQLRL